MRRRPVAPSFAAFRQKEEIPRERSRCNRRRGRICGPLVAAGGLVRPLDGRQVVSGSEMVGLALSAGLLAYLLVALLKPEWFA